MRRTLNGLAVALLLALSLAPARASAAICEETAEHEHEKAEGEGHGKRGLPEVVFNHVSNEREVEFENPLSGDVLKVELPQCKKAFGLPWLDLSITKHLFWLWVGAAVLILIMAAFRPRTVTPGGFPLVLEMLILFVRDELAKVNIGEPEYKRYTPYLLTAFFFILTMNLMGIVPYTATPTGNLAVTAALAICTFLLTQWAAIRSAGVGGYLAHLTGGTPWYLWPIMIPVEVLGLFTKPFALCVRLFANMVAGHVVIFFLLGLIFILHHWAVAIVSVPFATAVYMLEIFVAFLQAYVFTMLSAVFIGMAVATGHHGHEHHDHHEPDMKLNP